MGTTQGSCKFRCPGTGRGRHPWPHSWPVASQSRLLGSLWTLETWERAAPLSWGPRPHQRHCSVTSTSWERSWAGAPSARCSCHNPADAALHLARLPTWDTCFGNNARQRMPKHVQCMQQHRTLAGPIPNAEQCYAISQSNQYCTAATCTHADPVESPFNSHVTAQVFKGTDTTTGDLVAIKQLSLAGIPADNLAGIMGEIDLLRNLNHRNIVKYIGATSSSSEFGLACTCAWHPSIMHIRSTQAHGGMAQAHEADKRHAHARLFLQAASRRGATCTSSWSTWRRAAWRPSCAPPSLAPSRRAWPLCTSRRWVPLNLPAMMAVREQGNKGAMQCQRFACGKPRFQ